jgi:hypothetical protein
MAQAKSKYKNWGEQPNEAMEHPTHWGCHCEKSPLYADGIASGRYVNVGFTINSPYGDNLAIIFECQVCFEKFWIHANKRLIESLLRMNKIPKDILA